MGSNLQDQTSELTALTIRVLREITGGFCDEQKLGQGGYGKVYKGVHGDGKEIAVKLLFDMLGHDDEAFEREFDNLMKLNHPNIVRLVGYCYDTERQHMEYEGKIVFGERTYRALCFELMHNGSLKKHLYEEHDGLDWCTRYKIIRGTCDGLKYLHKELKKPIYHLDLKPDNILLDKHMVPKLADFGLSQIFDQEQSRITQNHPGTFGYMPPEYIQKNQVMSNKVDIFSLGVVMINIITGPGGRSKSAEMPFEEFIYLVNKNWRNRLQGTWSATPLEAFCQQVNTCTKIALRCVEDNRHKRPSIEEIIHTLNETETVINELNIDEGSQTDKKGFYTMEPASLTMRVLQDITNNFSEDQLIGVGQYGKVYRGSINGEGIAVKLFHDMNGVDDKQFRCMAENLTRLKHPNIVRLVGYCCETEVEPTEYMGRTIFIERTYGATCLEYMQNGSLPNYLYDELEGLGWQTRYNIIKGTCEGLKYLHEGLLEPIYHLDLKPDNILLDKDMVPKLTDFALSQMLGEQTRLTRPSITGTIGYMPPEYIFGNLISSKSDIFSLGIVIIKIIAGPRGLSRKDEMPHLQEFIDQVNRNWRSRLEATSNSPGSLEAYCKQVNICTTIALRCIEHDRHKRPSIVDIIHQLNETEAATDKVILDEIRWCGLTERMGAPTKIHIDNRSTGNRIKFSQGLHRETSQTTDLKKELELANHEAKEAVMKSEGDKNPLLRLVAVQELLKEKILELDQLRSELQKQREAGEKEKEDLRQLLESKTREVDDLENRVKVLNRDHEETKKNLEDRIKALEVEAEKSMEALEDTKEDI